MPDTLKIKLQIAADDAMRNAELCYTGKAWLKAPNQNVICDLIKDEPQKGAADILSVWNRVFSAKINELAELVVA